MKEFITSDYITGKKQLEEMIDAFNDNIKNIDKSIVKCIEGKDLIEVSYTDLPSLIKNMIVEKMPTFNELLAVGVDLREQVVIPESIANDIMKINILLASYDNSLFSCASIVNGKVVVNQWGIETLESFKIKLNKKELELYNKLQSVIEYINSDLKADPWLLYSIFNNGFINQNMHQTNVELNRFKSIMNTFGVDKK